MADYLSHIVEQSRGVTPGVQPLIAPMFAPPSFSAFISLEDLVQQQTPGSVPEEAPEAPYTSSLALPDLLAAQSSHVPIEPVEPQPLQEKMIGNDKASVGTLSGGQVTDLSSAPPIYRPTVAAMASYVDHDYRPGDRNATSYADHDDRPVVAAAASYVGHGDQPGDRNATSYVDHDDRPVDPDSASYADLHKVSGEPPEPLSPLAPERDAPKNLDLLKFDETPVGADLSRPSPIYRPTAAAAASYVGHGDQPGDRNATSYVDHDYRPVDPNTASYVDLHKVSGEPPEPLSPIPSEGNAPKKPHLSVGHIPSSLLPGEIPQPADQPRTENGRYVSGAAVGEPAPSAVPGERDELLSPRDPRRSAPAYQHESNLAPEPDAQQRPKTGPRVDDAHRSESVIRVSIGRVEVRATAPPAAPVMKRAAPAAPALSLSDYLKRRKGGTT